MAIANADGSIILTTKVEDSGLKKGMEKIISEQKAKLHSLTREYAKLITNNQQNTEEAKKLKKEIDNLSKSIKQNENILKSFGKSSSEALEQTSEAVENSSKSFSKFQSALKGIAEYLALAFSVTKLISFSNEAGQLATQAEASVLRLVDIYGSASDSVGDFIDANARALGMSKAAAASFSSVYGNLFSVWAEQATNAELTNRYLNMTAVVASKTGRTVEDVQERVRSGLLGNTEAIEDLGIFVNVKTIEMTDAFQRMAGGKSWEQLDAYTQQQIRSMAILEQATAKYGDEVADTSATIRNKFNAAYQDFQNSWGQIVNQVLIPVLETLTEIFNIATSGLNALSGKSGNILEGAKDTSRETADNIDKQTDAQKDLNNEMKKTLAGFDDIEILSAETADNTSGNTQNPFGNLGNGSIYEKEVDATLTAIMGVVGFAMAAIGAILLLTGNIGWGLGFLIAGAATLSVTMASVKKKGVGIDVQNALTSALVIAGVVAIVLGIILCMCNLIVPGISLITYGAVAVAGTVAINWDSIKNMLQNSKVQEWVVVVGIVAIALGVLLCFVQMWGLGIGLIALGAAAIVTTIAVNWDAIMDAIKGAFNAVTHWIKTYGLLVLGIILCLTVAGIPYGIALIIKWVKDGSEKGVPLANAIVDKVKEAWEAVKNFWNTYIAPVFTAKWWEDLGKEALNGLIWAFESALNFITGGLRDLANSAIGLVNSIGETIGVDWKIEEIPKITLPRLAQGAVIPPNHEFLAVLGDQKQGTNIEAPLQTIVDAFNVALSQNGNYSNGGNIEVVLEIDGREFGRAVVEHGNEENRRIGTRLVIA